MIRKTVPADAESIARIYNHYIKETVITFEKETVTSEEMRSRIVETTRSYPWLVFETKGQVVGYAYASSWKSRSAYLYTVESTVYLDHSNCNKGIGTKLYACLLEKLREASYHTVIAGIALPNSGSVALHEKFGFEQVAHYKDVGWKFDKWIDVGSWQLKL